MTKKKTPEGAVKRSIPEAIAEFIATCPYLKFFDEIKPKVGVEIMEEEATSYMIESVPANPVVKSYTDGSQVCQAVFAVISRESYDDLETIDTSVFYENFANWLTDCSRKKELPKLDGKLEAQKIEATTPGYLYDEEGSSKAKYRIQCVLKYYKPSK